MSASFLEHVVPVQDPRVERSQRHALLDIVLLAVCAVVPRMKPSLVGRVRSGCPAQLRLIWLNNRSATTTNRCHPDRTTSTPCGYAY
jgi:hypothetical protein